jgi:hypothetical protein
MEDHLIPPSAAQDSQRKNSPDSGTAKKSPKKATQQGANPNLKRGFNKHSAVAGLAGFILLGLLFVFFWWFQEIAERFHLGYWIPIFIFLTFVTGVVGIAWLLIEMFNWVKLTRILSVISCLAFAAFLIFHRKDFEPPRPQPEKDFSIKAHGELFAGDRMKSCGFSFIHLKGVKIENGTTKPTEFLSPINMAIYVQFTNLKNYPLTIDSYSIETKTAAGSWQIFPDVDVRTGTLVMGLELWHVIPVDITDAFISVAQNGSIAPRQTIYGWIFLVYPKGFDGNTRDARFHMLDTAGNEYIEPLNLTTGSSLNTTLQNPAIIFKPGQAMDVSRLPITPYAEN